jgi:hypothetical protein
MLSVRASGQRQAFQFERYPVSAVREDFVEILPANKIGKIFGARRRAEQITY